MKKGEQNRGKKLELASSQQIVHNNIYHTMTTGATVSALILRHAEFEPSLLPRTEALARGIPVIPEVAQYTAISCVSYPDLGPLREGEEGWRGRSWTARPLHEAPGGQGGEDGE